MKKKFLSLTLGSLLVSTLSAEDNGFFVSAGYQIGESAQMVKNTKGIQDLSDSYERLNNLLTSYSTLNTLIRQSTDPNAINNARTNLNASAKNLINDKANSPAYQAVLLALNAAAGLWQVMSYAISPCGPGKDSSKNGGVQTFENTPTNQWGGTTITCGTTQYEPGPYSIISTENYAKINKAYQIIQKAFGASGKDIPALSDTNTELKFTINQNRSNSNNKEEIVTKNNAQELLKQASTIITTLNSACPWINNGGAGGASSGSLWEGIYLKGDGSACGIFKNEISAIQDMIKNAEIAVEQSKIVATNAQNLAYTLANFSSQYKKLGEHYDSITAAVSSLPDAQSLQNVVSKKTNPNSPQGIQDNYYIDSNIHSQVQSKTQELGSNPFRRAGLIAASTTNNGAMNGIGFQVGYKQFFGKNKRWGARYYGFVDYNHTYNKSQFFNASSDVWTYGVGSDLLVNFINDKATKNNKISFGAFGGIQLAGTSWLNSQFVNLANVNNYYKAKINTSNFQFLFNLGLRTNLARNKRRGADHSAQHGMELGVKIPTINTNYYSLLGTTLQYRRLYSVYLNYVFAY
ncbi:hypothetical protein ID0741_00390 [Helicobacter pylori]